MNDFWKNYKVPKSEPVYWYRRDGSKIAIDEMDEGHVRNALKMVMRTFAKVDQTIEARRKKKPSFRPSGEMAHEDYVKFIVHEMTGVDIDDMEDDVDPMDKYPTLSDLECEYDAEDYGDR